MRNGVGLKNHSPKREQLRTAILPKVESLPRSKGSVLKSSRRSSFASFFRFRLRIFLEKGQVLSTVRFSPVFQTEEWSSEKTAGQNGILSPKSKPSLTAIGIESCSIKALKGLFNSERGVESQMALKILQIAGESNNSLLLPRLFDIEKKSFLINLQILFAFFIILFAMHPANSTELQPFLHE